MTPNISCIGAELAKHDFSGVGGYKSIVSQVKTADAKPHQVSGILKVSMTYKGEEKEVELYFIPTIAQRLILGIDFWRTFQLALRIVGSLEPADSGQDLTTPIPDEYPLTKMELHQLEAVKEMFPNFEKQGFGRTSLIKHHIDTGNASFVKQRHYAISPAVEKVLYTEIDRILELKVIAPSPSAWSSPIRMVGKNRFITEDKPMAMNRRE